MKITVQFLVAFILTFCLVQPLFAAGKQGKNLGGPTVSSFNGTARVILPDGSAQVVSTGDPFPDISAGAHIEVLSGVLVIIDQNGIPQSYGAGESFSVIPNQNNLKIEIVPGLSKDQFLSQIDDVNDAKNIENEGGFDLREESPVIP